MKITFSLLLTIGTLAAADPAPHPDATFHAVYQGAAENFSSISVLEKGAAPFTLTVPPALQGQIKDRFQAGDFVIVTSQGNAVQAISPQTVRISLWDRTRVLVVTLAVHIAFGFIVLGGNFKKLLIGEDNRYSNSKCQMAFWFGILAITYLSTTFLRWAASGYTPSFAGGVDLPKNLLLLSGLSVFSFGAAKGITATRQAAATAAISNPPVPPQQAFVAVAVAEGTPAQPPAAAAVISQAAATPTPPPPIKTRAAAPRFPQDLLCDDNGNPDVGDYQMMAVTAMAIGVYVTQMFGFLGSIELLHHVTIPDVDSTILATFGLGQGAYLIKKTVS